MLDTGLDGEGASTVLTTKKLGMSSSLGVVTMDNKVANKDNSFFKVNKNKMKSKLNAVKNLDVEKTEDIREQEPYKKKKKKIRNKNNEEKGKVNQPLTNCGEVEDVAESVDSGCIVDSTLDIADMTDWPQVEAVLLEENNFITNFLKWVPGVQPVRTPGETDMNSKKRKQEAAENLNNKRLKEDAARVGAEDLEELQERYQSTLATLRKNRKKKLWDPATRRKETKLNKKLSRLQKRKDKRDKRKIKLKNVKEEMETKKEVDFSESVKQKKPIYNQKGELVFSKFDFSNSSASREKDSNLKPKDLKQLLSQALKEKEKAKRMEQKGDAENASKVLEQKAWSFALQKAEGLKVHSDPDLIKKSIKKKESSKKTSQKNWEQRKEFIEKKKAEKQNFRLKNIKTRKEAKLSRKMKRMKKKGHVVPGF